jgi:hypothetical protein
MIKMEEKNKIVYSQATCLNCNTVLVSRHRHDFVKCPCNNETFLDGGFDYVRFGGKDGEKIALLTLNEEDPHNIIRDFCEWGSRGINGTESLKFTKIKDLGQEHLEALIVYPHISDSYRKIMINEKNYRTLIN